VGHCGIQFRRDYKRVLRASRLDRIWSVTEMLALIVTACLSTEPLACSDHLVQWVPANSAGECLALAAPLTVVWLKQHPTLTIQTQRCLTGRRGAVPPNTSN
jgi:hypothetical protein